MSNLSWVELTNFNVYLVWGWGEGGLKPKLGKKILILSFLLNIIFNKNQNACGGFSIDIKEVSNTSFSFSQITKCGK